MLLAPLFGTALIIAVAANPLSNSSPSAQEKAAATTTLARSATDCIVRAVITDPRYGKQPAPDIGDLIVNSMPACLTPVRAMIAAYDRYYGDGTGEAFFIGLIWTCCRGRSRPGRRTRRHSAGEHGFSLIPATRLRSLEATAGSSPPKRIARRRKAGIQ